ncbi:putative oxidoreductase YrbE [Porphyridium purpureum]|uniref:Putative oxidoreductase YrbE n=1 Tax=Porphyridium purpureum TaxID=35688 RepID=A0A5J4Z070_PORPP|nr:putative oxidoreductase YrbE [Porphyridium purpureum]|eukprot:POR4753..scf208_2
MVSAFVASASGASAPSLKGGNASQWRTSFGAPRALGCAARRSRAAAAGTVRMNVANTETLANVTNKDAKKVLNIGIIGAGRIGQVHADTITFRTKGAKLVGVASGTKQLADRCSLEHGCQPYYEYHDLLENPEVDAVCICSASNQHTEQIIEAAKYGKHIFCEKPIDTNLEVVDKALVAVKEAGVKLQVGFNRRFDQNYRRIKQAVDNGEIGTPHMIHITSRDPSPPPIEYVKNSGGIWLDCSIHDFDMARFLIGSEVEEVYALGACNINPDFAQYGDIDTSLVTLKFANGVIGTIDNSRQAVFGYDQRCEVFGSGGSCEINNNYANSAVISTGKKIERDLPLHFFMDRYTESFVTEMNDFINVCLYDAPIPCTGIDGRAPVVIALAAKKSYQEGRPVKLSEVDVPMPAAIKGWNGQM